MKLFLIIVDSLVSFRRPVRELCRASLFEGFNDKPNDNTDDGQPKNYEPGSSLPGEARIADGDLRNPNDAMLQAEQSAAVRARSLRRFVASVTSSGHDQLP
jgi:hypothetical protein